MNISPEGRSQDFDLNLAPIIDCFTVLIAFVMISSAFASVGILDAGVAAGGEQAKSSAPPPVRIGVDLLANHQFNIHVAGRENREIHVRPGGEDWDLDALKTELYRIKKRWPGVEGAVLKADDNVAYNDVVKSMDAMHSSFPAVMLGGL